MLKAHHMINIGDVYHGTICSNFSSFSRNPIKSDLNPYRVTWCAVIEFKGEKHLNNWKKFLTNLES